MRKFVFLIFSILAIFLLLHPVSAVSWTINSSAYNIGNIDLVNSTGMKDWMYYLIVTNSTSPWDFPVIGFAGSIMLPFTTAFKGAGDNSGSIVYVILFGLLILMVWRNSGRVAIPLMLACIVGGGFSMIMPESSTPIMMILLIAGVSSVLFTWFAKE
jgi:hypothetical protein